MSPTRAEISIIIPAFRAWATLPLVLAALEPQLGPGREVVLVESSGDDEALDAVARRWPWLRVLRLSRRTLPGKARNLAAQEAASGLVAFLDADAVPAPDWLDRLEGALAPELVGVMGAVLNGTPESRIGTASYLLEFSEFLPGRGPALAHAASCNLLFRRSSFLELGGFPENVWPGEDTIFTFELCAGRKIAFAPDAQVRHVNRVAFRDYLRHQRRLGVAYGQICSRVPTYPRRLFGRRALAPVAAPLRLAALAKVLAGHPSEARQALGLLPILIPGVAAWGAGIAAPRD